MAIIEVKNSSVRYIKFTPEERKIVLKMRETGRYGLTSSNIELQDTDVGQQPEILSLKPPVLITRESEVR